MKVSVYKDGDKVGMDVIGEGEMLKKWNEWYGYEGCEYMEEDVVMEGGMIFVEISGDYMLIDS